jgi:hypothetical protein
MGRIYSAELWPRPPSDGHGMGDLAPAEIAIAIRTFETTPELCIDQGRDGLPGTGVQFPTLAAWLDYVSYCWHTFGVVPSGV